LFFHHLLLLSHTGVRGERDVSYIYIQAPPAGIQLISLRVASKRERERSAIMEQKQLRKSGRNGLERAGSLWRSGRYNLAVDQYGLGFWAPGDVVVH
jgi:hypothetical protein